MKLQRALELSKSFDELAVARFNRDTLIEVTNIKLNLAFESRHIDISDISEDDLLAIYKSMSTACLAPADIVSMHDDILSRLSPIAALLTNGINLPANTIQQIQAQIIKNLVQLGDHDADEIICNALDFRDLNTFIAETYGDMDTVKDVAANGIPTKDNPKVLKHLTCFNCKQHPVYYIDNVNPADCSACQLKGNNELCEECALDKANPHVVYHSGSQCGFGAEVHHQTKKLAIEMWQSGNKVNGR